MLDLTKLNPEQLEAVNKTNGYYMIMAGAGTGKTRVLTYRIVRLIELGVSEYNICAFSFTNKATREMKHRIEKILGRETNITIQTFHSFAYSYLSMFPHIIGFQPRFAIIDDYDKEKLLFEIIKEHKLPLQVLDVKKAISQIKNHNHHSFIIIKERLELNIIYNLYQKRLKELNKMDLDDLLLYFYKFLSSNNEIVEDLINKSQFVLVDEFQDTNKIQYEIVIKLSSKYKNIFCVGDEDQSIYSFRGSNITNIEDFINNKKAETLKLEQNYRSSKNIIKIANKCISNNTTRINKTLYTNRFNDDFKVEKHFFENTSYEVYYIISEIRKLIQQGYNYKDIAILYRNNNLSIDYEEALLKASIPYDLTSNKNFFKFKEIKTLISYLRFIENQNDDLSLQDILIVDSMILASIMLQAKTKQITYYASLILLLNTNQLLKDFISLIDNLKLKYQELKPNEFMNYLLDKIDYINNISKESNGKNKVNRIYTFVGVFKEFKSKEELNDFLNKLNISSNDIKLNNSVTLQTIHQAKGLEYKIVFLIGCSEKLLPWKTKSLADREEERRIFYVDITRAMDHLYLLHSKQRNINGNKVNFIVSSFIKEII